MASPQTPAPPMKLISFETPTDYLATVLKTQLGNSDEFLAFERFFYYTMEELKSVKNTCEELRALVSKTQEEKRSLELQLITEKSFRDQESKNALMELNKISVQHNAEIYSVKYEVETWKRKSEAVQTECNWLKEQLKAVEMEKHKAVNKLTDMRTTVKDFERYRVSFDAYSRRLKESIQNSNKLPIKLMNPSSIQHNSSTNRLKLSIPLNILPRRRLDELEKAKQVFVTQNERNMNQLNMISSQLLQWKEQKNDFHAKISQLQRQYMEAKAEIVQNVSKLTRAEMIGKRTTDLANKLLEENTDLQKLLNVLAQLTIHQITEDEQKLIQKSKELHQQMIDAVNKLSLKQSELTPPSEL